jgi:hypothetical protein
MKVLSQDDHIAAYLRAAGPGAQPRGRAGHLVHHPCALSSGDARRDLDIPRIVYQYISSAVAKKRARARSAGFYDGRRGEDRPGREAKPALRTHSRRAGLKDAGLAHLPTSNSRRLRPLFCDSTFVRSHHGTLPVLGSDSASVPSG